MLNTLGLIILIIVTSILFILAFLEASGQVLFIIPILLTSFVGIVIKFYDEYCDKCRKSPHEKLLSLKNLYSIISLCCGAFITYYFSVELGMGPVVSAGLIGILAAVLFPSFQNEIYCGAFVGMVSQDMAGGILFLLVAAVLTSLIYILSRPVFNGVGGKLGTMAFTGCLVSAIIFKRDLIGNSPSETDKALVIFIFSILASLTTYYINVRLKKGPVLSSGLAGLLAGLLLPLIYPDIGDILSVIVICASFAGMSSPERIKNELFAAGAGVFSALFFILSMPHMGGVGGKLGTIAFGSTLAVAGMYAMYGKVRRRISGMRR